MAQAIFEPGLKMAMICCHRLQVASRAVVVSWRRSYDVLETRQAENRRVDQQAAEEAAIAYVLDQLGPAEVDRLIKQAVSLLPEPLVRRNPTLSNPFVRGKVYELACGEPIH